LEKGKEEEEEEEEEEKKKKKKSIFYVTDYIKGNVNALNTAP
jgi:hypothetical protein